MQILFSNGQESSHHHFHLVPGVLGAPWFAPRLNCWRSSHCGCCQTRLPRPLLLPQMDSCVFCTWHKPRWRGRPQIRPPLRAPRLASPELRPTRYCEPQLQCHLEEHVHPSQCTQINSVLNSLPEGREEPAQGSLPSSGPVSGFLSQTLPWLHRLHENHGSCPWCQEGGLEKQTLERNSDSTSKELAVCADVSFPVDGLERTKGLSGVLSEADYEEGRCARLSSVPPRRRSRSSHEGDTGHSFLCAFKGLKEGCSNVRVRNVKKTRRMLTF